MSPNDSHLIRELKLALQPYRGTQMKVESLIHQVKDLETTQKLAFEALERAVEIGGEPVKTELAWHLNMFEKFKAAGRL